MNKVFKITGWVLGLLGIVLGILAFFNGGSAIDLLLRYTYVLFIALAPSLGFLGTVIGMVQAFDAIEAAGDISPNIVAGGMKVALITTVGGLIVAMILQVFYNYILSRIDALSIDMENASIDLVDVLAKNEKK